MRKGQPIPVSEGNAGLTNKSGTQFEELNRCSSTTKGESGFFSAKAQSKCSGCLYHNFSIRYAMLEHPNFMYRRKQFCLESMLQDAFGYSQLTQIKSTFLQARVIELAQNPDTLLREWISRKPSLEMVDFNESRSLYLWPFRIYRAF